MSQLRRTVIFCLLFYWLAIFAGTHLPSRGVGGLPLDKLLHLAAYTGLSFLLACSFAGRFPNWRNLSAAALTCIVYGALDELSQIPIPGRHGDIHDWYADCGGAALGLLAYGAVLPLLPVVFHRLQRWRSGLPEPEMANPRR